MEPGLVYKYGRRTGAGCIIKALIWDTDCFIDRGWGRGRFSFIGGTKVRALSKISDTPSLPAQLAAWQAKLRFRRKDFASLKRVRLESMICLLKNYVWWSYQSTVDPLWFGKACSLPNFQFSYIFSPSKSIFPLKLAVFGIFQSNQSLWVCLQPTHPINSTRHYQGLTFPPLSCTPAVYHNIVSCNMSFTLCNMYCYLIYY